MSDITSPQTATPERAPGKDKIIGGARFLSTFFLANAAMYGVFQGMQQILLPSQIAAIDPVGKVVSYGILASIGALVAAVGNPLFGSLSDRTRSRFGRRSPWLLISAIVAALGMVAMAGMNELFWLGAAYLLVMMTMSAYQAVISAVMPDRVPESRRGLVSSIAGLATALGVIYGITVTPAFAEKPFLGYLILGLVLVVAAVLIVTLSPDPTAADTSVPPRRTGSLLQSFKAFFSGLADHDFAWAFWARFVIMVGFWTVSTYQLYALSDYIGVENIPGGSVAGGVALLGILNLGGSVITTVISGPLSDKLGRRKIFVVIASLGIGAGALIPAIWPTWGGMVAYSLVVGFFFGIYTAVDQAIMTLVLPHSENNARDLGLLNVATTGPQISGPFIAALIITVTGGYAPLFIFCAIFAVAGAFLILPIRRVR